MNGFLQADWAEQDRIPLLTQFDHIDRAVFRATMEEDSEKKKAILKAENCTRQDIQKIVVERYSQATTSGRFSPATHATDSRAVPRSFTQANTLQSQMAYPPASAPKQAHNNGQKPSYKTKPPPQAKSLPKPSLKKSGGQASKPQKGNGPPPGKPKWKMVDNVKKFWCDTCGRWSPTHGQPEAPEGVGHQTKAAVQANHVNFYPSAWHVGISNNSLARDLFNLAAPWFVLLLITGTIAKTGWWPPTWIPTLEVVAATLRSWSSTLLSSSSQFWTGTEHAIHALLVTLDATLVLLLSIPMLYKLSSMYLEARRHHKTYRTRPTPQFRHPEEPVHPFWSICSPLILAFTLGSLLPPAVICWSSISERAVWLVTTYQWSLVAPILWLTLFAATLWVHFYPKDNAPTEKRWQRRHCQQHERRCKKKQARPKPVFHRGRYARHRSIPRRKHWFDPIASFLFTLFLSPLRALAQRLVDKINDLDTWIHSPDEEPGEPVPQHNRPYPIVQEGDNSAVLDPEHRSRVRRVSRRARRVSRRARPRPQEPEEAPRTPSEGHPPRSRRISRQAHCRKHVSKDLPKD